MIKAIFLDLDNTLVDRDAAFLAYIQGFFVRHKEDVKPLCKPNHLDLILQNDNHGYTKREEFCAWFVQQFQVKNWTAERFWLDMKNQLASYIPPVAPQIIQQIKRWQTQYIVAILSNGGSQNQRAKLHYAGLGELFKEANIFISGDMGISKPDPLFFITALARFQLAPQEAILIGDDPINDVWGAHQVGLWTAWIEKKGEESTVFSHFQIKDLMDIQDILDNDKRTRNHISQ